MEGDRFVDLVRTGQAASALEAMDLLLGKTKYSQYHKTQSIKAMGCLFRILDTKPHEN
jgi:hypothetical protein